MLRIISFILFGITTLTAAIALYSFATRKEGFEQDAVMMIMFAFLSILSYFFWKRVRAGGS